jgi:hypothetical protein
MEQSPSREANSVLASPEIPRTLWKRHVLTRVHKSLSLGPIPDILGTVPEILGTIPEIPGTIPEILMQSVTSHPTSLRSIFVNLFRLHLALPSDFFP